MDRVMDKDLKAIRKRVADVNRRFGDSRKALREWAEQEGRKLDALEAELRMKDEAIDVTEKVCSHTEDLAVVRAEDPLTVRLEGELRELLERANAIEGWAADGRPESGL